MESRYEVLAIQMQSLLECFIIIMRFIIKLGYNINKKVSKLYYQVRFIQIEILVL